MTDPNLTHVAIVIDRSGSMDHLRSTVVSGLNEFLSSQRKARGECKVTLVFFDGEVSTVYVAKDLREIRDFTAEDYVPNGMTALYDGMGTAIQTLGGVLAALPEHLRPSLVNVLTITDGQENSSRTFSKLKVRELVEHQKSKYSWTFQFLGANQDGVLAAAGLGIDAANAATFTANGAAVKHAFYNYSSSVLRGRDAASQGADVVGLCAAMAYSSAERASLVQPDSGAVLDSTSAPVVPVVDSVITSVSGGLSD